MAIRKPLTFLFICCLAGCVPSLHQFYTRQTLVYDPAIAGTWQQDDERWEFVGDPNTYAYALTITDKNDKQSKLIAHLVEIDEQRFFDFYPAADAEIEAGDWLKFHLVPVHLFFKVEKTEEGLSVAAMNPDAIQKLLAEKPEQVKHELVEDDRVILTDTPQNLQKFVIDGMKTEGFFGKPVELRPVEQP